jgi:hypothetical protein
MLRRGGGAATSAPAALPLHPLDTTHKDPPSHKACGKGPPCLWASSQQGVQRTDVSLVPLARVRVLVVQQLSHTPPKHTLHTCTHTLESKSVPHVARSGKVRKEV